MEAPERGGCPLALALVVLVAGRLAPVGAGRGVAVRALGSGGVIRGVAGCGAREGSDALDADSGRRGALGPLALARSAPEAGCGVCAAGAEAAGVPDVAGAPSPSVRFITRFACLFCQSFMRSIETYAPFPSVSQRRRMARM
jgi:hypothetical protein